MIMRGAVIRSTFKNDWFVLISTSISLPAQHFSGTTAVFMELEETIVLVQFISRLFMAGRPNFR
jgi:hypothetical protein